MAENVYIGVDNKAKEIDVIYIGINNVAREVVAVYIGDKNNKAKLIYSST